MNDYPETIPVDNAASRRHEWQCRQGRCEECDDPLRTARGMVWCTIGCLALWCAAVLAILA